MFSLTSLNENNLVGQLTIAQIAGTGGVSKSEDPLHRRQHDRRGELKLFSKVSFIQLLDIRQAIDPDFMGTRMYV